MGGVGLRLSTRDICKFGNFLLFEGKQLLNADWIREAVSKHIVQPGEPETHGTSGYGYQFWMNRTEGYRADGAFGQFCIVIPRLKLVIAMNSGSHDMQGMMDVIFDGLVPALNGDVPFETELGALAQETDWQKRFRRALLEDENITYEELFKQ
jgi:CubicO group peptidase (beta-lactamase class C family)